MSSANFAGTPDWSPLLPAEHRSDAAQSVVLVARILVDRLRSNAASVDPLALLLLDYLEQADLDPAWETPEYPPLDAWSARSLPWGLIGGNLALPWYLSHVTDAGDRDMFGPLEEHLLRYVKDADAAYLSYDLISGLVGYAVYLLSKPPSELRNRCLGVILERLAGLAREVEGGIAWLTPWEQIPQNQRPSVAKPGYFNFGVAHGTPGIAYVLAEFVRRGICADAARSLLDGSLRWFEAQGERCGFEFPSWVPQIGEPQVQNRAAWCYGSLGMAVVFALIARTLGSERWMTLAHSTGMAAEKIRLRGLKVPEAGLCHGAAGMAHAFARLHSYTGTEAYRGAAVACYARTLELRVDGLLRCDYGWGTNEAPAALSLPTSFLGGAAGAALALLASISDFDPGWDSVLLLSMQSHANENMGN